MTGPAALVTGGQKSPPSVPDFGRFSGMPTISLADVLLLVTVGAPDEETGWRGYALPQLQRRFSTLTSSLIIAVLWFGWHLPQFSVIPPTGLQPGSARRHKSRARLWRGRPDLAL